MREERRTPKLGPLSRSPGRLQGANILSVDIERFVATNERLANSVSILAASK